MSLVPFQVTNNNSDYNNSNCRLCRVRDEMINPIVTENNKQALKEYKTRHN